MIREVLIWPDPRLKEKSKEVGIVDAAVRKLVDDMFETMYAEDGVGLAAPQLGVHQRVIVIDTNPKPDPDKPQRPICLINPVLVGGQGQVLWNEGCLSVPGEFEDVERFETITVRALNRDGCPFEITDSTGLLAIALQHETDHLEGKMFVDRLSTLKREVIRRRMKRLKEEVAETGLHPKQILREREEEEAREIENAI